MVFPLVMYGCESWPIKKTEHRRIDTFALWCWGRLLRVLCIARRSNQSVLKEISPEYSLEGLMLKLKLHLMRRTDSLEKTLMLRKIEGKRRKGWQRMRWLDGITDSMDMSLSSGSWWWTGKPDMLQSIGSQRVDTTEQLNWTELKWTVLISGFWRVSEIILWGLTQCLADNKQSINNRNCYRENFVHAIFFLGKQLFIIERQVVSWHLLWPFYYWEKITSGPKSWLIYILCLWTAKLSPLWFSERNKGQWQGKFGFTTKWTLPEPSFG